MKIRLPLVNFRVVARIMAICHAVTIRTSRSVLQGEIIQKHKQQLSCKPRACLASIKRKSGTKTKTTKIDLLLGLTFTTGSYSAEVKLI